MMSDTRRTAIVAESLPALYLGLGVIFLAFAWADLALTPVRVAPWLGGPEALSTLAYGVSGAILCRRPLRGASVHVAAALALVGVCTPVILSHIFLLRDPKYTSFLAVLIIALGCIYLSWRALLLSYGVIIVLYCLLCRGLSSSVDLYWFYSFVLLAALALGIVTHAGRMRAFNRLFAMTDAAEAAAEAKGQFLANMSHEIRTPMNGVLGMLDALREQPLEAEAQELAQTAHDSARSLLHILNDILDLSKLAVGKVEIELRPMRPREVLRSALSLFEVAAQRKGLELRLDLAADLPLCVLGDRGRLHQVLLNLIGNAVKFTAQGRIVLSAQVAERRVGSVHLHLAVIDTGIGISKEHQARLFQPFAQADGSTTRRFGGTGLGLSISAQLVALMGGRIVLESTEGQGSTFLISLPCELADEVPEEAPAEVPAPLRRPLRILCAEDNPVNRQILLRLLRKWGHEALMVEDGASAVEAVVRESFDLVLMDVQMPRMDGREATAVIRGAERAQGARHLPILALTASVLPEEQRSCEAAGMDGHVAKPIEPVVLQAAIARACGLLMK